MSFNRKELKVISSAKKKQNPFSKDILYTPRGQYDFPFQPTRVPGSNMTMQGVPYPMVGIGSTGQQQMMYPGGEYSFPGSTYVDELPIFQTQGEVQPATEPNTDQAATNYFFDTIVQRRIDYLNSPQALEIMKKAVKDSYPHYNDSIIGIEAKKWLRTKLDEIQNNLPAPKFVDGWETTDFEDTSGGMLGLHHPDAGMFLKRQGPMFEHTMLPTVMAHELVHHEDYMGLNVTKAERERMMKNILSEEEYVNKMTGNDGTLTIDPELYKTHKGFYDYLTGADKRHDVSKPLEIHARLGAIKEGLQDAGIDIGNQKITKEDIDQWKKTNTRKDSITQWDELKELYGNEEEIINLLNEVVYQEPITQDGLVRAKHGGSKLKKYQTEGEVIPDFQWDRGQYNQYSYQLLNQMRQKYQHLDPESQKWKQEYMFGDDKKAIDFGGKKSIKRYDDYSNSRVVGVDTNPDTGEYTSWKVAGLDFKPDLSNVEETGIGSGSDKVIMTYRNHPQYGMMPIYVGTGPKSQKFLYDKKGFGDYASFKSLSKVGNDQIIPSYTIPEDVKRQEGYHLYRQSLLDQASPTAAVEKFGGQYMDLELTDEQIKQYKEGGFVVEDLPIFQEEGEFTGSSDEAWENYVKADQAYKAKLAEVEKQKKLNQTVQANIVKAARNIDQRTEYLEELLEASPNLTWDKDANKYVAEKDADQFTIDAVNYNNWKKAESPKEMDEIAKGFSSKIKQAIPAYNLAKASRKSADKFGKYQNTDDLYCTTMGCWSIREAEKMSGIDPTMPWISGNPALIKKLEAGDLPLQKISLGEAGAGDIVSLHNIAPGDYRAEEYNPTYRGHHTGIIDDIEKVEDLDYTFDNELPLKIEASRPGFKLDLFQASGGSPEYYDVSDYQVFDYDPSFKRQIANTGYTQNIPSGYAMEYVGALPQMQAALPGLEEERNYWDKVALQKAGELIPPRPVELLPTDNRVIHPSTPQRQAKALEAVNAFQNRAYQQGGEYMDVDLTDDQIKEWKEKGFVVEELPEYQTKGQVKFKPKEIAFTTPDTFSGYDPNLWYGAEHYDRNRSILGSLDRMQKLYEEGEIKRKADGSGWDYDNQIKANASGAAMDYNVRDLRDRYENIQNWMQGAFGTTDDHFDVYKHWNNDDAERYKAGINKLESDIQHEFLKRYPGATGSNPNSTRTAYVQPDGTITGVFSRRALDEYNNESDRQFIREEEKEQGYVSKPYSLDFDENVVYGKQESKDKQATLAKQAEEIFKEGYQMGWRPHRAPNYGASIEDLESWITNNQSSIADYKTDREAYNAEAQAFADELGIDVEDLGTQTGYNAFLKAQKETDFSGRIYNTKKYEKFIQPSGFGVTWEGTDEEKERLSKLWHGAPTGNETMDYLNTPTGFTTDFSKVTAVGAPFSPFLPGAISVLGAIMANPLVQTAATAYGIGEGLFVNAPAAYKAYQEEDYETMRSELVWGGLNLFGGSLLGAGLMDDVAKSTKYLKGQAEAIKSMTTYMKADEAVQAYAKVHDIANTNMDQWQRYANSKGFQKHMMLGADDVKGEFFNLPLDEQTDIISKLDRIAESDPQAYADLMKKAEMRAFGTSATDIKEVRRSINRTLYKPLIKENPNYYEFLKSGAGKDIEDQADFVQVMQDPKNVDAYIESQLFGVRGINKKNFENWQKSLPEGDPKKGQTLEEAFTEVRKSAQGRNARKGGLFISNSPQLTASYGGKSLDDATYGILKFNVDDALAGKTGISKLEAYNKLSRRLDGQPSKEELEGIFGKVGTPEAQTKLNQALMDKRKHELEWQYRDKLAAENSDIDVNWDNQVVETVNGKKVTLKEKASLWAESKMADVENYPTSTELTYNDLTNDQLSSQGIKWLESGFESGKTLKSGEKVGTKAVGISERRVVDPDAIVLESLIKPKEMEGAESLVNSFGNQSIRKEELASQFNPAIIKTKDGNEVNLYTYFKIDDTTPLKNLEGVSQNLEKIKSNPKYVELTSQLSSVVEKLVEARGATMETSQFKNVEALQKKALDKTKEIEKLYSEAIELRNKVKRTFSALSTRIAMDPNNLQSQAKRLVGTGSVATGTAGTEMNRAGQEEQTNYRYGGQTDNYYMELELDDNEIKAYQDGGFTVEEVPETPEVNLHLPKMGYQPRNVNPFMFSDVRPMGDNMHGLLLGAGVNAMFNTPVSNLRAGIDLSASNFTGFKDGKMVFNEPRVNAPTIKLHYTLPNKKR